MNFQRIENASQHQFFYYPTRKFKTTTLRVFVKAHLAGNVEGRAILPFLLKRGSVQFPSQMHISRRLESLYGAMLSLDISKMGELQVLVLTLDVVNARYIQGSPGLLAGAIDLLNDLFLDPVLEDGAFPEDRFQQEKRNLTRYVESVIDDKAVYAHLKLISEMFRGEPYSRYEWGQIDRIKALDRREAFGCYRELLASAPVDVYVVGQLSPEEEAGLADRLLPMPSRKPVDAPRSGHGERAGDDALMVEEQPVEQSKLEMGFRVDMSCGKEEFYALVLYNAILGGGSFSKLFKRVREEASLAYYASSSFDKLKGFLYVTAGIDTANFEKAAGLVRTCMAEMADARIQDEEIDNAKKSILNGLRSIADNPHQMIDFNHIARTAGRETDDRRISSIIQAITKEQVAAVARFIHSGKTFFLKGTGNPDETETH